MKKARSKSCVPFQNKRYYFAAGVAAGVATAAAFLTFLTFLIFFCPDFAVADVFAGAAWPVVAGAVVSPAAKTDTVNNKAIADTINLFMTCLLSFFSFRMINHQIK
jgi:hypothetical protein